MKLLVLGTVQLGLNYGINNKSGKPSEDEAMNILEYAYQHGIDTFDTAAGYGGSEEVIGRFIKKNDLEGKINVITKLLPNIFNKKNGDVNDIIEQEIIGSMVRLNISSIYGYLLHTPAYIHNNEIVQGLIKAKKKGLIKNYGVSIYEPEDALYAVENKLVDFIQVPYNVFDQRLDKVHFFNIAEKNNIKVFVRTIYIQGLALMQDNEIPDHLKKAIPYLHRLDAMIKGYGISRKECCLLFAYQSQHKFDIVIGLETPQQLEENINILKHTKMSDTLIEKLQKDFGDVNDIIFSPSGWGQG